MNQQVAYFCFSCIDLGLVNTYLLLAALESPKTAYFRPGAPRVIVKSNGKIPLLPRSVICWDRLPERPRSESPLLFLF